MSLFSIVVPSHDRPDLLDRLLGSIRRQTFRDYEVIVVDDASSDEEGYRQVIERHSVEICLRYIRNPENRGAQHSRNRGVTESTGELVAFVDDDDEWLEHKLERQGHLFERASRRLGLVYSWADAVDEAGTVVHRYRATHRGDVLVPLLDTCFLPSPTIVVTRQALREIGGFDEEMRSCQDWDTWTRIVAAGYEVDVAAEVLAINHKHGRASVGTSPRRLEGFARYYGKHAELYERAGLMRSLSEKYRGLAHDAARLGHRVMATEALQRSVSAWPWNWKAWVRYAQLRLGVL